MATQQGPLNTPTTGPRTVDTGASVGRRSPMYGEDDRLTDRTGMTGGMRSDYRSPREEGLNPPPYSQSTSSDEIRRETDRTRSEMDRTIDAIGERLRPRHLIDDALDWMFGAGGDSGRSSVSNMSARDAASGAMHSGSDYARRIAKGAGTGLLHQMRKHPVPAALIGAGIAYMMFDDSEPDDRKLRARYQNWREEPEMYGGSLVDARTGEPYDLDEYGQPYTDNPEGPSRMDQARGAMSSAAASARYKSADAATSAGSVMKGAASSTGSAMGSAASSAGSMASRAGSGMAHGARSAASGAGHMASDAARYTRRGARSASRSAGRMARRGYRSGSRYAASGYETARDSFSEAVERSPLLVGVGMLAAGVLAGLALPRTRRENQWFGDEADEVRHGIAEYGREAYDRGRDIARATADAATEEARRQGLTPSQLREKAQHVGEELKRAGSDAAKQAQESVKGETGEPSSLIDKVEAVAETASKTAAEESSRHAEEMKDEAKSDTSKNV